MLKEKGKGMLNQQNEFFWGDKILTLDILLNEILF